MNEYEPALQLLQKTQAELSLFGAEMYQYGGLFHGEYTKAFGRNLMQTEPFRRWEGKWLVSPFELGRSAEESFAEWVLIELFMGRDPRQIVQDAASLIAGNSASFGEVFACRGVVVEDRVDLCAGAYLERWDRLLSAAQMPSAATKANIAGSSCALVMPYVLAPVAHDNPTEAVRPASDRGALVMDIRRALILSSTSNVSMSPTPQATCFTPGYPIKFPDVAPAAAAFHRHSPGALDLEGLRLLIPRLHAFGPQRSIHVAVDRLNSARQSDDVVDAAIDFGIALEVALMHGDPASQEISTKIGTRAGWLLGHDVASRRQVKSDVAALYTARSEAAHQGYLEPKTLKKFSAEKANATVTAVINKILARGAFPDWTDLVFGIDVEETTEPTS